MLWLVEWTVFFLCDSFFSLTKYVQDTSSMHAMVLTYSLGSAHVTRSGQPNAVDDLPYLLLDSLRLRMIATTGARRWQAFAWFLATVLLPRLPYPLCSSCKTCNECPHGEDSRSDADVEGSTT
jgi:hypothetical protein